MMKIQLIFLCFLCVAPVAIADDNPAIDAIQEYMDFADYSDGAISTTQLASVGAGEILFIDTRNPGQYASGHIPDAKNIEWREVLARKEEIPMDKTVVLYCDTGLLSAKAHLALRLAGYENVKVLQGGYPAWPGVKSRVPKRCKQRVQNNVSPGTTATLTPAYFDLQQTNVKPSRQSKIAAAFSGQLVQ